MKSAIPRKERCRVAVILSISILTVFSGGCSREPGETAWFQSTETGGTLTEDQLRAEINRTDSLFDLYDMKREYILRGGDSREIMAELNSRRDQLVEEAEAEPAIEEKLDFLGWNIEKIDRGRYRVSCYFVVTGKMERDWILKLLAKVDKQHIPMLPPEWQKAERIRWQVFPKTSTWEPGEHKIISEIVELESIPYNIYARFYLYPEKIFQDPFFYGWFADPPESEERPVPEE